jgi:signal transduction histidine kinase
MGTTGPVNPAAAGEPPGRGPGGSPAAPGARPAASAPAAPSAQAAQAAPSAPGAQAAVAAAAGAALRAPFTARTARELLFCLAEAALALALLAVPFALAGLAFVARLLAGGTIPPASHAASAHRPGVLPYLAGLLVILVLLVMMAPRIGRWLGRVHRGLAARLAGQQIGAPPPPRPGRGVFGRLDVTLRDGPGWRAVAYLLLQLPVAVIEVYAVFFAAIGLANLSYPFWWPLFRNHPPGTVLGPVPVLTPVGSFGVVTQAGTFAAFAAGAAMILAAPWVARGATAADCWMMRGLLGPGRLAQRVIDLEQSRAIAVQDSAAVLRRLERDLHDGAQIRLATLAMNLGLARDKLGADADPQVRELVDAAHQGAKDALVELRNLARGIHPPALDNGLADALATLAAGSALPVELSVALPERPGPEIETIAYFCAAELLANAAKHSHANHVRVELTELPGRGALVLRVGDDGAGGADPARGSGLSGLAQRVRTVDGRVDIVSPAGGPTRVTVTLPMRA